MQYMCLSQWSLLCLMNAGVLGIWASERTAAFHFPSMGCQEHAADNRRWKLLLPHINSLYKSRKGDSYSRNMHYNIYYPVCTVQNSKEKTLWKQRRYRYRQFLLSPEIKLFFLPTVAANSLWRSHVSEPLHQPAETLLISTLQIWALIPYPTYWPTSITTAFQFCSNRTECFGDNMLTQQWLHQ